MPSGPVPPTPPQLPPLSPQPSLASPSNWKLHYPPEEMNPHATFPPSSWTTSSPYASLRRSNSAASSRRLPDTFQQQPVAGDSLSHSRAGPTPSFSGSGSSSASRSRSRSRSGGSHVPLPVLPSASSSEPIVISSPMRTHSRSGSASSTIRPPPTSRPNSAGKDAHRSSPRPFPKDAPPMPKQPKHAPPPPLPIPDRGLERASSLHIPQPPQSTSTMAGLRSVPSPVQGLPTSPAAPQSAPPPRKRYGSTPQFKPATEAVAVPSPIASRVPSPLSAPVRRLEKEKSRVTERPNEKPSKVVPNPDQPFMDGTDLDQPHSAPIPMPPRKRLPSTPTIRSATIPTPAVAPARPHDMPSSRPRTTSHHTPRSRAQNENEKAGLVRVPPPSAFMPVTRGRTVEVTVAVRPPPPGLAAEAPAPPPKRPVDGTGFARKWVLEKKGKRLTQDSMFVAQQLRMLR